MTKYEVRKAIRNNRFGPKKIKMKRGKSYKKSSTHLSYNDWNGQPCSFYESQQWRKVRYIALLNAKGSCQCCGATPVSSGQPLHVDHIKSRSKYPDLELDPTNLQVLCFDCNLGKGNTDETDWR